MKIDPPNMTIIAILIIFFAFGISMVALRRKFKVFQQSSPASLQKSPVSGVLDIPVLVSYTGIKGLGALSIAENNFNPMLVLYDSVMEYRVLRTRSEDYGQIERVRCVSFLIFNRIQFIFKDRNLTFSAHVANMEVLQIVAEFLRNKGIEVLIRD